MSFKVVPPSAHASSDAHVVSTKATAHPITGTHDAMRYGLSSAAQNVAPNTASPLQARLEKWSSTQAQLQHTMQRNTFGLSVPLRQSMETKIVSESPHHPLLLSNPMSIGGSHNLHLEILNGTDENLDVGDFMSAGRGMSEIMDVSGVMERSRGI